MRETRPTFSGHTEFDLEITSALKSTGVDPAPCALSVCFVLHYLLNSVMFLNMLP